MIPLSEILNWELDGAALREKLEEMAFGSPRGDARISVVHGPDGEQHVRILGASRKYSYLRTITDSELAASYNSYEEYWRERIYLDAEASLLHHEGTKSIRIEDIKYNTARKELEAVYSVELTYREVSNHEDFPNQED